MKTNSTTKSTTGSSQTKGPTKIATDIEMNELQKLLVIVSPEQNKAGASLDSALVNRALALSKASGCEVEFFHICHDKTLTRAFFTDPSELHRERQELLTREATLMAEFVVRLDGQGATVHHDTRWDSPRTEAILRKIDETRPDLVMKESKDHGYFIGLLGNTDWDLVRRSPSHLWFVTENGSRHIDRVVTAVGSDTDDDEEMISAVDYDVFRLANLISEKFGATNYPVHAYQVPRGLSYAAYAPYFSGLAYPITEVVSPVRVRREIAEMHGRSIEAFAEYFHTDADQVRVVEGDPSDVLPEAARSLKADLIVMAARNLSRWDRFFESVTAEPVLAAAPCDIVFVKDSRDAPAPAFSRSAVQGVPAYDLEAAVLNPKNTFGTPKALGLAPQISAQVKKRLLQIWEQDIDAQMALEDDGGPVKSTHADTLREIKNAKRNIAPDRARNKVEAAVLTEH